MPNLVDVAFYARPLKEFTSIRLRVPSGGGGISHRQRIVCNDYAFEQGSTHFIIFETVEGDPAWSIYQVTGRSPNREVVGRFPTKEAAEMWLVHLA